MNFVKCYDVAELVIEEASARFAPLWQINTENLEIFKQYCEVIDSLANEFDGESFDVEVDEIAMDITIVLECSEIIIEDRNHIFYKLAKRTKKYGFSVSDGGNLLVKFVFPSLWEKA